MSDEDVTGSIKSIERSGQQETSIYKLIDSLDSKTITRIRDNCSQKLKLRLVCVKYYIGKSGSNYFIDSEGHFYMDIFPQIGDVCEWIQSKFSWLKNDNIRFVAYFQSAYPNADKEIKADTPLEYAKDFCIEISVKRTHDKDGNRLW
jgi:hypothetical protein